MGVRNHYLCHSGLLDINPGDLNVEESHSLLCYLHYAKTPCPGVFSVKHSSLLSVSHINHKD